MIISCLMDNPLFSVRMRASCRGQHLAGAERLVSQAAVEQVTADLMARALSADSGEADDITCRVERINPAMVRVHRLPDISTFLVRDHEDGRSAAARLLIRAGVAPQVAADALALVARGAGPGGVVMRGAVIMDAATGTRLEPDPSRGIRVSRMDVTEGCRPPLEARLQQAGLGHRRVFEALVLAGKVLGAPGMLAELCWSDDPQYISGYVATPGDGYQRISAMKPKGDPHGGRVVFVEPAGLSLQQLIHYLEKTPVLFNQVGMIRQSVPWRAADE